MMRKPLVGAAICAASILGLSGAAFAGEVTGAGGESGPNGDGTTGMRDHAKSICGFSGLEDGEDNTGQPGNVQNWGHAKKELKAAGFDVKGANWVPFPVEEGCNPNESADD